MSLKEKIVADVKTAMKNKEPEKLESLRFLHAAIKNKEIELRPKSLTDDEVLAVIKKMAKQQKDSIDQFEKAGRTDLAENEKRQLKFIEDYLPEQLSKEKIEAFVIQAISTTQATSVKEMGAVMKEVLALTQGAADNKLVSEIVRSKLS